jgi:hypothetical protein
MAHEINHDLTSYRKILEEKSIIQHTSLNLGCVGWLGVLKGQQDYETAKSTHEGVMPE